MPKIEDLFNPHTARSGAFNDYEVGDVAFVTNGFRNNGVLGFVKPQQGDKVFDFTAIALSAFCEATVQHPPFMARGNGGSGLIVLEPREHLTMAQLGYLAAWINAAIRWRFSWSRQASVERVRRLEIPEPKSKPSSFAVSELLPQRGATIQSLWPTTFESFTLDDLFEMKPGDYHNASDLPKGSIPLISCGDTDNGIVSYVSVPEKRIYHQRLTIAFNGMNTLTAKYHPYSFAAKDDVAVCKPRAPMRDSTVTLVQVMLNRERWRYSYYRKCFMEKLKRFQIMLPSMEGKYDEDSIERLVEFSPYWQFVKSRLA